jgi:hypothetical protein
MASISSISSLMTYLLIFCGAISAILVALVIYGNVLDTRADEEIYLNKTAEKMLAGDQAVIVGKMTHLARIITVLAIITGVALLATAGIWVYIGLYKS